MSTKCLFVSAERSVSREPENGQRKRRGDVEKFRLPVDLIGCIVTDEERSVPDPVVSYQTAWRCSSAPNDQLNHKHLRQQKFCFCNSIGLDPLKSRGILRCVKLRVYRFAKSQLIWASAAIQHWWAAPSSWKLFLLPSHFGAGDRQVLTVIFKQMPEAKVTNTWLIHKWKTFSHD